MERLGGGQDCGGPTPAKAREREEAQKERPADDPRPGAELYSRVHRSLMTRPDVPWRTFRRPSVPHVPPLTRKAARPPMEYAPKIRVETSNVGTSPAAEAPRDSSLVLYPLFAAVLFAPISVAVRMTRHQHHRLKRPPGLLFR